jgi:hypothetical protein
MKKTIMIGANTIRHVSVLVLCLAVVALTAQAASAAAELSFVRASAALSDPNLVVSFKEIGLTPNLHISYQAAAQLTQTGECVNNGGQVHAVKVTAPVFVSGTFLSSKHGSVTQSLTLTPPAFSCPSGQTLAAGEDIDVSYTSVTIKDTTNNLTDEIPGTFSS